MFPIGPLPKDPKTLLPWASRFYLIRVVLVGMVLAIIATTVFFTKDLKVAQVFLFLFGAIYPHLLHVLLGRFEGRRLRGHVNLLVDGFFAGAVMPAIGFATLPCLVFVVISLFNWVALGGIFLAVLGAISMMVGLILSNLFVGHGVAGHVSIPEIDFLAYGLLLTYFFLVAWVVYRYAGALQRRCVEYQSQKNTAEIANLRATRALLAVLPPRAARELQTQGDVCGHWIEEATLVHVGFSEARGSDSEIADLQEAFRICDEIFSRHGIESVKTWGRRYLALAGSQSGADEAVAASLELLTYLENHGRARAGEVSARSARIIVHCGSLETGLVQTEKLNYDLVGLAVDEINALAGGMLHARLVVTEAARERLRGAWRLEPLCDAVAQLPLFTLASEKRG